MILAALLVASMVGGPSVKPAAPCGGIPWRQSVEARERLIRCASRHFNVPGGYERALEIARCESGFDLDYDELYGTSAGVFQHQLAYWPARVEKYLSRYGVKAHTAPFTGTQRYARYSPYNAWASVFVTLSMASDKHIGWKPWSCAS